MESLFKETKNLINHHFELIIQGYIGQSLCMPEHLFWLSFCFSMARHYSRRKGKSGSKRPENVDNSSWANKDVKAIKEAIQTLGKAGKSASQIGIVLRDSYAVPDVRVATGKSLSELLKESGIQREVPDDLLALIKRDIAIVKHIVTSKKDMTAKRGEQLTLSKINRLVTYYKSKGILSKDWKYDRAKAVQWIV